ncbi:sarcosine oxidase subunit gamma (plasmid) [Cupriavidus basilensis]
MDKLVARTTVTNAAPGVWPVEALPLSVKEVPLSGIIRIQGPANDLKVVAAIERATGLKLPTSEAYSESGNRRLARVGPNEWLLFTDLLDEQAAVNALSVQFASLFATATLISDSRVVFAVSHTASSDFMAKGCGLDFHPEAFPTGFMRSTRFAGLPAAIAHVAADTYLVYLDVSLAQFAMSWMLDAADEFKDPALH